MPMPMPMPKRWLRSILALPLLAGAAVQAETPLERGNYLLKFIVACGVCHTPQGAEGPLPGMALAGGLVLDAPPFTAISANITPDLDTGIGRWTDAQLVTAIREGRRPDGRLIGPPMPFALYRQMSDTDVAAIVVALRAVPAVRHVVGKSEYRMALPSAWGPPLGAVADVPRADPVAYGRYLAGPLGHCVTCHTPMNPEGGQDFEHRLGAGGMVFPGPWGTSIAANLTPRGLARYADAELKVLISTGVRPDGSRLKPPMAVPYYGQMTDADLGALVAYLRSLPSK